MEKLKACMYGQEKEKECAYMGRKREVKLSFVIL